MRSPSGATSPARPVSPSLVRRAHSLCGISRTVGLAPVVAVTDPLEDLMRTLSSLSEAHQLHAYRGAVRHAGTGARPRARHAASVRRGLLSRTRRRSRRVRSQDLVSVVRAHSALHEDASTVVVEERTDCRRRRAGGGRSQAAVLPSSARSFHAARTDAARPTEVEVMRGDVGSGGRRSRGRRSRGVRSGRVPRRSATNSTPNCSKSS